ncbi:MAG TPA: type II toxin-antitoxin system RelE/ParE family toxin [Candidatus Sulfotelmatobacter sp.]|jgi:mRNA interferase RelE/StbE|nr:type II toxin-antitoxin system RelE/ParE family toxin [Candidatus Sulfotelmatobacter sp.]
MASSPKWKVEIDPAAQKELDALDKPIARRISKFLYERVAKLNDPRQIGECLQGTLSEFWRYRVGDYRLICSLEHDRLVVLVLRVGHRREIYSR